MSSGFATPVQRPPHSRVTKLNTGKEDFVTIPASPFMKRLGYGTGVSVYLYERSPEKDGSGRSPWAVKKTRTIAGKTKTTSNDMERRLAKEAAVLKELNHPNIVGFRALTRGSDGSLCLSMEKGERALMDLIEEREEKGQGPFPAKCIYQVAHSLAKALSYLHNTCYMLHGDLKSANVLIHGDFQLAKLCDFGVTLKLKKTLDGLEDFDTDYVGTQPWNAMEVVIGGTITDKTDMYSYGLIIWEMIALAVPHVSLLGGSDDDSLSFDEDMDDSMCEDAFQNALGTRPPLPNIKLGKEYQPLIELFCACTDEDPKKRPSANLALKALEGISV
ncbi:lymphokine-activated killer T-cell-originated protein kinase-like [Amphiura filiformis]|uniref:lymphokine-activated killer T-cell-originated protein kinase-like n=1 Tax=Amphiura filiformis TaxID=82378 RepID=UPI003B21067B